MKYYCNPINVNYRYQFNATGKEGEVQIHREAADPSMICYKGIYYIFASKTLSVWSSVDLVHWESHRLPDNLPLYDYAPDVRVLGEYVYFCASKKGEVCDHFRTRDVIHGPYERIPGTFDFYDPNLFVDDDGKVYFYWGCDSVTPIRGVELDSVTMEPKGEPIELIWGNACKNGYERVGEDNSKMPLTDKEVEVLYKEFLEAQKTAEHPMEEMYLPMMKGVLAQRPFIEGAWMDKKDGVYYLQYAFGGTEYNTYGNGVYISKSPLGPFVLAENNPYSYKPDGFITGAGHGSTMEDLNGNLWHTSSMRISMNHDFERRVGLWPAGYDQDGNLFCNQNYGDWPIAVPEQGETVKPWSNPKWMLLSYGKKTKASSYEETMNPELICDENIRTWWCPKTAGLTEWIELDLEKECTANGIQINFADRKTILPAPDNVKINPIQGYIDEGENTTGYLLEGSLNGKDYFVIEDKTDTDTDLSHDFIVCEDGIKVRYLRLSQMHVPYEQRPCISGLRVFGSTEGTLPKKAIYTAKRLGDLDFIVKVKNAEESGAEGYNIVWGNTPEQLYHSCLTYKTERQIGALVAGRSYYVRVDSFNARGITIGEACKLEP